MIWDSILQQSSTASSKYSAAETKNILVLGESQSGKKSIIRQLQRSSLSVPTSNLSSPNTLNNTVNDELKMDDLTLGLHYHYVNIMEDEETLTGRLGFYVLNYSPALQESIISACKRRCRVRL